MYQEILNEVTQGFAMRSYYIGLQTVLSKAIHKQRKYKGEISDDELMMISVRILTFLLEADYLDYPVTKQDIQDLLADTFERIWGSTPSEKALLELTDFFMISVLQNEGQRFIFQTMDFETNEPKIEEYRLVEQRTKLINGEKKEVYLLLQQGRQLLYATREIQDNYGVNYEEMRIGYLISKRRFSQANLAALEACKLAKNNMSEMLAFIEKTKRGYSPALEAEFVTVYDTALDSLREKKEFSESLNHQINLIYEEIKNGSSHEERLKNLEEVVEVQKTLGRLLRLHQQLLTTMIKLNAAYDHAIEHYELLQTKGIDFEKDILELVEKQPLSIFNMMDLFQMMGSPRFNGILHPLAFYAEQASLLKKTATLKTAEVSLVKEEFDESEAKAEEEKKRQQQQEMKWICQRLFSDLERAGGELELKTWVAELEESEEEDVVQWFGKEVFRYVLATLFGKDQEINLEALKRKRKDLQLLNETICMEAALAELVEQLPYLEQINYLSVQSPASPEVFEYAYAVKDESDYCYYEVELTNYIIKGDYRDVESEVPIRS